MHISWRQVDGPFDIDKKYNESPSIDPIQSRVSWKKQELVFCKLLNFKKP